ncbi:MAG TPA: ABC transporter permease [Gemmatimonadaceae bacterium]|nr:ABC transporter permease [Gemmatimonadaceae bacterium]
MPDWKGELERRLAALRLAPAREAEVREELAQHLDDLYDELRGRGVAHDVAFRTVLDELDATGGLAAGLRRVETRVERDPPVPGLARSGEPFGNLWRDLRFAARLLLRNPVFSSVAVLTLALGIGLNTAVFSAIEAMLLRPLPAVPEPDRLVQVYRSHPQFEFGANSVPHFNDLRERTGDVFEGATAWRFVPVNLSSDGRTERILGQMVSADFFRVMRAPMSHGRGFLPHEDTGPGGHQVAVLGHSAWRSMFAGDSQIVGREITLNGRNYQIVGVAGRDFRGPIALVEPVLWVPLMQIDHFQPGTLARLEQRGTSFLNVVARLRPDVTIEQARDRMRALTVQLGEEHPGHYDEWGITLVPQSDAGINPQWRGAQVGLSGVLMAVVVMLLLIACVNVANLFLARASQRAREMAVRLSLGAGRRQLVRQLLTESVLFALIAGAAGLLLARAVIGALNGVHLPIDIPLTLDLRLSAPVLGFTLGLSLITGLVFGLVPALQATSSSLVPALKGEAPAGGSRSRASRVLVVAQMSLSLVLLVAAGLFLRNLQTATQIDTGFDSEGLLLATVDPGLQGYDRTRAETFYATLASRLSSLPGVRAVGFAEMVPLGIGSQQRGVEIPGYTPAPQENMSIDYNIIGPGYFEAMGILLRRGRGFTARDDAEAARAIVINERFAERFWPGEDALGRTVRVGARDHAVIGITPTGKYRSLGEPPRPYYYLAQAQFWNFEMTMHLRTAGDPSALVPAVRAEVRVLDPDLPLTDVRTMTDFLGIALLPARLAGTVLAVFGLLGLVLAAVGMYGVMAYGVAQRTHEIGIRIAIGAAGRQVVRLVMRQGLTLVAIGAALGLAGALGAWRVVRGLLYGPSGPDLVTFVGVPVLLIAVAAFAIWIPARRAAMIDPMVALRSE